MKTEELGPLPPGWDSKFDPRTGRYYFINHYTMSTSWEDPRVRYQQIGKPTSLASSSKEHKFPTHTLETSSLVSASSKMTSGGGGAGTIPSYNPHDIPIQDFTSPHVIQTSSAIQPTMGVQSSSIGGFNHFSGSSNPYAASPHNILRLQVEDSINNAASPKKVESSFIDPDLPNNSYLEIPTINQLTADEKRISKLLECNSKNKIDIQYLKSVFPSVEEYVLLDVLSNSDNNVQKASDRLIKMGNVKRDTPSAPRLSARKKEEERLAEKRTPLPKPPPIKTDQEKVELRKKMIETYETRFDIPERILFMALESVLYDEEQANNLINSMIEDDLKRKKAKELEKAKEKQKKEISKAESKNLVEDCSTVTRGTSTQEDGPGRAKGPNPALCKGPNDGLLLKDYVTWNGPDPSHAKGVNNSLASGPNSNHLSGCKNHLVKGHQESLAKGPKGLNKGSMYKNISKENETTRSS
ncbi:unnamed protein product [Lepeophtheirus salmonis]|uniref:(salmon louse) hypothetical protein n=1 Tax=Lepeophtheirus salmonis TaxID=72036 RepID=A0A7R8CAL4_LEPSM|nr:unnamed protein product [Lepeophtheirus salmonis]CAF2752330.1 unnamed protein product [Lepeophtheirus salmonis]